MRHVADFDGAVLIQLHAAVCRVSRVSLDGINGTMALKMACRSRRHTRGKLCRHAMIACSVIDRVGPMLDVRRVGGVGINACDQVLSGKLFKNSDAVPETISRTPLEPAEEAAWRQNRRRRILFRQGTNTPTAFWPCGQRNNNSILRCIRSDD